jgi:hypothetical protein
MDVGVFVLGPGYLLPSALKTLLVRLFHALDPELEPILKLAA